MPNLHNIHFEPRYSIKENNYDNINFEKRTNMFKGTIVITVVYGIVAFLLMMSTAFSPSARLILFDNFLPFTLVFIIGTILIICLMLYFIFSYIPVNVSYRIDGITCPDYWDVELLDDNYIENSFDPSYPSSYFKYKCVMNKQIFDTTKMFKDGINEKSYKYTNILNSLKTDSAGGLSGIYDSNKLSDLSTNLNDSSKNNGNYVKLYKDMKNYTPTNIKNFVNTNSDTLSLNIYSNLINIALLQNNYKSSNLTDLLSNSNVYSSAKSISPVLWKYNKATENTVGIGTTTSGTTSLDNTKKAIILNWNGITPEIAFNNGYEEDTSSSNIKMTTLNVYYNNNESDSNLNKIGRIETTSNASNNPAITMKFISDVSGIFDNILLGVNSGILSLEKIYIYKTKPSSEQNTVGGNNYVGLTKSEAESNKLDNKKYKYPIIQLYNPDSARPSTYDKANPLPLNCDELYPSLLASLDDDDNNIRCSYSKICGIPWSDLRCQLTSN
jgi:hypothetical protein